MCCAPLQKNMSIFLRIRMTYDVSGDMCSQLHAPKSISQNQQHFTSISPSLKINRSVAAQRQLQRRGLPLLRPLQRVAPHVCCAKTLWHAKCLCSLSNRVKNIQIWNKTNLAFQAKPKYEHKVKNETETLTALPQWNVVNLRLTWFYFSYMLGVIIQTTMYID